jgi:hypothetical protein
MASPGATGGGEVMALCIGFSSSPAPENPDPDRPGARPGSLCPLRSGTGTPPVSIQGETAVSPDSSRLGDREPNLKNTGG